MHALAPLHPQKIALISASILLCLSAFPAQAEEIAVTPQPPDILLGPLFNDVQNAKLFPDQKTFADAVPNSDPLMILADYRMQQNQSGFDLRHFVNVNFRRGKICSPERTIITCTHQWIMVGVNSFNRKYRQMGFSSTVATPLCRAGRTFSGSVLLGQLLHHAGPCRKRPLG